MTWYPEQISKTVVSMISRMLLKELSNKKQIKITITCPMDSPDRERRVTVFSGIGGSLFGGQGRRLCIVERAWRMGRFTAIKVIYQPKAVGECEREL